MHQKYCHCEADILQVMKDGVVSTELFHHVDEVYC